MRNETPNYHPHAISPDGKFGVIDTGLPDSLQQEAVVYFPNGYKQPTEHIQTIDTLKGGETNENT